MYYNPQRRRKNEAFRRVLRERGYEQRPDGLYQHGEKFNLKGKIKISGETARRLTETLRAHDRFRANSMTRSAHKVLI